MLVGVEAAKELYANQRFHTLPREPPQELGGRFGEVVGFNGGLMVV